MTTTTDMLTATTEQGGSLEAQGGWQTPLVGANADNEANAGVAAFNGNNEASNANVNIRARLTSAGITDSQGQPHLSVKHDAGPLRPVGIPTVAQHRVTR